MIHKYTSVKEVIAKVYQDLDLKEDTHRVADMIQWAGEALERIGAFPTLVTKVAGKGSEPIVEFSNYQARLPYDVHTINQIAYSTKKDSGFVPMYKSTNSFGADNLYNGETTNDSEFQFADAKLVSIAMGFYNLTYAAAVKFLADHPDKRSMMNGLLFDGIEYVDTNAAKDNINYKYTIAGQYVKMNVEKGYLMVSYQAIPTDAEGYPEIPDLASFKEALYWYINMKLSYPEWKAGKIRDAVYYDARSSWNFYCKQAYAEAMMPNTPAERRAILNTWVRLVPEIEEDETFYKHLGDRQYINLD